MPPMPIEFCLPKSGKAVPSGPDWLQEVKYDGYRLMVRRDGSRVRCVTRRGNEWPDRFPSIVEDMLP
jgi:bifunctional non-homologous end joining protein LigD